MVDKERIARMYREADFDYQETTEELVEMDFKTRTKGQEIKRKITQIYRKRLGNRKEFILYNIILSAKDQIGNSHTMSKLEGRHQEPEFNMEWDESQGKAVARGLVGHETIYDIPFSKENMQNIIAMDDFAEENQDTDEGISFALDAGYQKFGGFSEYEFLNKSFDELLAKATNKEYVIAADQEEKEKEKQPVIEEKQLTEKQKSKREENAKKLKEIKKGLYVQSKDKDSFEELEQEADNEITRRNDSKI